jgi:hypothetical protein
MLTSTIEKFISAIFMASEDIINHIIRDIVAKSTTILRQSPASLDLSADAVYKEVFVGGILSYNQRTIVTDTLAAFVIRSVVLDPNNEFGSEQEMTTEQVDKLIQVNLKS